MKASVIIVLAALAPTGPALASDDRCQVPRDQWQPQEDLKAKLEAQGWAVARIKVDDGCFEAYARDADGRRVEAYFDPATLEPVKMDRED